MFSESELLKAKNLLIRGTNWIGDVIMSLPALSAVRNSVPGARITVLAKPWVADLYRLFPGIDEVIIFQSPGCHDGLAGKTRLAKELRQRRFDAALLFQNAIEAAIITALARIPARAGYTTDGRRLLLTHPVKRRKGVDSLHQTRYYLEMVRSLGFIAEPDDLMIRPDGESLRRADEMLMEQNLSREDILVGIAPGAAYGPAKMWYVERYAALADRLVDEMSARILLFGSADDAVRTGTVKNLMQHGALDLAGTTSLAEASALMSLCSLVVSNDSGLMHLAGGLGVPLIAVFGSTNPVATSPLGVRSHVMYRQVHCSPCLKKTCPTDFACMDAITVDDVRVLALKLLAEAEA
ncbi:MAG: lipopolysaccharide heptosyltransferase II [Syntrophales bacterium]|nr:lipopolysaccharide heptosyltransferase II [Syntrophales bacterium]